MPTLSTSLILFGLILDIVGVFILSVEAIGVDRVQKWGKAARLFPFAPRPPEKSTFSDPARFVSGAFAALGGGVGFLIYQRLPQSYRDDALLRFGFAALGSIASCAALFLFLVACRALAMLLLDAQLRTRRKAAGLFGFVLLAIGFILQFAGTLLAAIKISN